MLPFHEWATSRMRIAKVVPAEHRVVFTGQSWEVLAKGHRYLVDNVREALARPVVSGPTARPIDLHFETR